MAPVSSKRRASQEISYIDFFEDDEEVEAMTADFGGMVDGEMEAEEALQTSDGASAPPTKRKRQNLTHLTEEERVMRRKLKNR